MWHVCEFGEIDHGLHFVVPLEDVLQIIRRSSAFIFTISEYQRRILFPMLGDAECLSLYRHVEIPPEASDGLPRDYFARRGALRLAIFASVIESKGQEDALRRLAELVRRGHNVELLMAGFQPDPSYRARLDRLIEEQKLQPYVCISGFVADVYAAMRQADIVLVCSRHEAFGRVAGGSFASRQASRILGIGSLARIHV